MEQQESGPLGPRGSCLTEQWGWGPAGSMGCRRRGEKQDTRAAAPSFRLIPSTAVAAQRSSAPVAAMPAASLWPEEPVTGEQPAGPSPEADCQAIAPWAEQATALAAGRESVASAEDKDSIVVAWAIVPAAGKGSTAFARAAAPATAADNTDRPVAPLSNRSPAVESSCGQKMGHTPAAGSGNSRLLPTRSGSSPTATSWGR